MDILAANENTAIGAGSQVFLHFSIALEAGAEIDNSRGRDHPVELTIGDGNLLPGFEAILMGLRAGDRRTAVLTPSESFGQWLEDNVQRFDLRTFENPPEIGSVVEFQDASGGTLPGVIKAFDDDQVTVDFNHPLAGRTIIFEVEIFNVLPPQSSAIELRNSTPIQ